MHFLWKGKLLECNDRPLKVSFFDLYETNVNNVNKVYNYICFKYIDINE
jgi:hypothetical protein